MYHSIQLSVQMMVWLQKSQIMYILDQIAVLLRMSVLANVQQLVLEVL